MLFYIELERGCTVKDFADYEAAERYAYVFASDYENEVIEIREATDNDIAHYKTMGGTNLK